MSKQDTQNEASPQGLAFHSGAAISDCEAAGQCPLRCGPVEAEKELMRQVDFPRPPQKMKVLLGIFDDI